MRVVAGEPNVHVAEGGRALYDYTTEAALLMPCALLHLQGLPQPPLAGAGRGAATQRCASLKDAGLVEGADARGAGRSRPTTSCSPTAGPTKRCVRVRCRSVSICGARSRRPMPRLTARYGVGAHPCGFAFAAQVADVAPRAATRGRTRRVVVRCQRHSARRGRRPDRSNAGVAAIATLPGLQCLRALWDGQGDDAVRVRKGVAGTRARPAARRIAGGRDPRHRRRPGADGLQQRALRRGCQGRGSRRALLAGAQCAAFRCLPRAAGLRRTLRAAAAVRVCGVRPRGGASRGWRAIAGRRNDRDHAPWRGEAVDDGAPRDPGIP